MVFDEAEARDITTWRLLVVFGARRHVASSPADALWASLICAQTGLWALALAWLIPKVRRLPRDYARENKSEIMGSSLAILVVLVALSVGGMVRTRWPNYLPGHAIKLGVLTMLGGLVGLVAARGIWVCHGGLRLLERRCLAADDALRTFLRLRDDIHSYLGVLGAIIGLLVLSTGAQRRAVLAYAPETDYGIELVLMYGFLFTLLVAAVYLPTYLMLTRVAGRICDAVFPAVPADAPEWVDRLAKRERLASVLQLERGLFGRMKASVAILTPLIGSLVGLLLQPH
jgi:hypothetical protein